MTLHGSAPLGGSNYPHFCFWPRRHLFWLGRIESVFCAFAEAPPVRCPLRTRLSCADRCSGTGSHQHNSTRPNPFSPYSPTADSAACAPYSIHLHSLPDRDPLLPAETPFGRQLLDHPWLASQATSALDKRAVHHFNLARIAIRPSHAPETIATSSYYSTSLSRHVAMIILLGATPSAGTRVT